jgi:hypothetical protein
MRGVETRKRDVQPEKAVESEDGSSKLARRRGMDWLRREEKRASLGSLDV